ncbi:MAG: ADP-forming succinate--CoA ligase subunit beta [Elusimicrobia bacterium]|nr:ADP-forming succinate--CoA ligase subunit beta [Elusimicrobiota bacterium]
MKLLEYEAKDLFRARGIPTAPTGGVIKKAAQINGALKRAGRGPWVLKAQVLVGGRGKAGGVQIAKTPKEAREKAKFILGLKLVTHQSHGQAVPVKELLIDRAVDIEREMYVSVAMDRAKACPIVIASAEGGMEIEELAKTRPEAILKLPIDPGVGLLDYQARSLAFKMKVPAPLLGTFVKFAKSLVKLYLDMDASLVEVNPLVVTKKGELLALDGKVLIEDNALYRHPEFAKRGDLEASALEKEAKKVGLNFIALDGDIGCLVNGAGLAMATMDSVKLAGGSPANFLDVGGGANAEQVTRAFQIILKDAKVRAILVNIFGGIMKCTTIAEGVLAAAKRVKLKVPLVVRLEGTKVEEGKEILAKSGLAMIQADSLWDAAQKAVRAAKSVDANGAKRMAVAS